MRTTSSVIQHRHALRILSAIVLSIAIGVVGIVQCSDTAAARVTTQSAVVTPPAAVMLPGTLAAVNNSQGDQTNPHVDRDRVTYTNDDFAGHSLIHLFDFSTATDSLVPGNGLDRLSNLSENRVAFSEVTAAGKDDVVLFDTTTQTSTVISGLNCSNPTLGGNLVAFEDRIFPNAIQSNIDIYDASTGTVTALTNDGLFNKVPSFSPTGNAIVWEKCFTGGNDCDIYSAIQTSPGVFTTHALTGPTGDDRVPDTNGVIVVYTSNRGGDTDVYYQPIDGGTETQIAIPGDQRDARISGNLIVFESFTAGYDIFVYDVSSGTLYQATNTPSVDEALSDISVWNGTGRIVYCVAGGFGDYDLYAFTFQVPNSIAGDINGLIALVHNFNLPHGLDNSLVTKLQDALAAINASDTATACDSMNAFINQCSAQSGKALTEQQANQLINTATQIRTELGCQ